jgi:hypothetical protein
MERDNKSERSEGQAKDAGVNLVLSWRIVAAASVFAAIAAIGTLVVVATVKDADALSTIALALAILAFVVQIMVFVAQVYAANQQATRNEEIYTRMHGLLEGLRGTTQGTHETLVSIIEPLLQAATNTASETLRESKDGTEFEPEEFQQRVLACVLTRRSFAMSFISIAKPLPFALLTVSGSRFDGRVAFGSARVAAFGPPR